MKTDGSVPCRIHRLVHPEGWRAGYLYRGHIIEHGVDERYWLVDDEEFTKRFRRLKDAAAAIDKSLENF